MSIEVIQNTHTIVHAAGEIDLTNINEFIKALQEAAERASGGFIIDLSAATYIDSAGIQAIYAAYSKIDPTKDYLTLIMGNVRIRSVLEMVHLEQLPGISIYANLDEAKQALSSTNVEQ